MTTIEEICSVLVNLIVAGVICRVVFSSVKIILEQDDSNWKAIRNLIIAAVLALAVYTLKNTILHYYQ